MILLRLYMSILNTDLIYGDIKSAHKALEKILKISENKSKMEGFREFARIQIDALDGKITVNEAKRRLKELSLNHPEVFMLDRENTGSVKKSLNGYIYRLEYSINRYDVMYPKFNMQRCDDL